MTELKMREYVVPGERKGWWIFTYDPRAARSLRWWQIVGGRFDRRPGLDWLLSFGVRWRAVAVGWTNVAEVRAEKLRRHRALAARLLKRED